MVLLRFPEPGRQGRGQIQRLQERQIAFRGHQIPLDEGGEVAVEPAILVPGFGTLQHLGITAGQGPPPGGTAFQAGQGQACGIPLKAGVGEAGI